MMLSRDSVRRGDLLDCPWLNARSKTKRGHLIGKESKRSSGRRGQRVVIPKNHALHAWWWYYAHVGLQFYSTLLTLLYLNVTEAACTARTLTTKGLHADFAFFTPRRRVREQAP